MSAPGDAEVAEARYWLAVWRAGPPLTKKRKKSLERLRKALAGLDDVAQVMLGEGITPKGPVQQMREQVALILKYWRASRKRDTSLSIATKFLVQAWLVKDGRSPLASRGCFYDFQSWATTITKDYGAPPPGERAVRYWLRQLKGAQDHRPQAPPLG